MMKRFINWLKEQITWFMSARVREAMNEGKTFDEVQAIVKEEVAR